MIASLYFNRHRSFSILEKRRATDLSSSTDDLLSTSDRDSSDDESTAELLEAEKQVWLGNRGTCCGIPIWQMDTSRFAGNLHSRILQKFPFLVEMFYWALNYVAYSMTKRIAAHVFATHGGEEVTALAQSHAIDILTLEHDTFLSVFFPITEVSVQRFFLHHQSILSIFNQLYSLVHIPGTVAFLSWYYYVAPNHNAFTVVRRTMTLGNFAAFFVFAFYPCMPPRLLPKSFGFKDTVRQENAESVWVGGANVNQLAAMPSLHFTYAFVIGCTFLYHSGIVAAVLGKRTRRSRRFGAIAKILYAFAAVLYPALVLTIIVATANHYYLDAAVATISVTLSYFSNRIWLVLQPLELALLWVLRLEKPVPTTGMHRQKSSRRHIEV